MPPWTCPNNKCAHNKQLRPGQPCPLCGKEAKEFKFQEFGDLLKEKSKFKKSIERTKNHKRNLEKAKFCPKCGSPNVDFLVYYNPSIWRCFQCGYEGTFLLEGAALAAKIQAHYQKSLERAHKSSAHKEDETTSVKLA